MGKLVPKNKGGSDRKIKIYTEIEKAETILEKEGTICTFSPAPTACLERKGDQSFRCKMKMWHYRGPQRESQCWN